jgi:hypothetical protein
MRGGLLHVAQWHPGVQCCGDEGVPQGVRPDGLGDAGAAGHPADDPPGAVAVQPPAAGCEEHRAFAAFADGQVDGPGGARRQRDGDDLAALTGDDQGPVAALDPQGLDVRPGGLRDPEPVEDQQ